MHLKGRERDKYTITILSFVIEYFSSPSVKTTRSNYASQKELCTLSFI